MEDWMPVFLAQKAEGANYAVKAKTTATDKKQFGFARQLYIQKEKIKNYMQQHQKKKN